MSSLEIYRERVKNGEIAPKEAAKQRPQKRSGDFTAVLASTPAMWRSRYQKVLVGGNSRATAMDIACAECVGFEDVVSRVGGCRIEMCPLWSFRPYRGDTE